MNILYPFSNAFSLLVIILLYLGGSQPQVPPFMRAPGSPDKWPSYRKCVHCYAEKNKLKELHRLLTIRDSISKSLNRTGSSNRTHLIPDFEVTTTPPRDTKFTHNLIFSSQVSGKMNDENVVQFNIYSKDDYTQIVNVYLWVFIKKRQKLSVRPKGRRIIIHVYEIDADTGNETLMTSLKTRIKKSQYQKIMLPVQRLSAYMKDTQSAAKNVSRTRKVKKGDTKAPAGQAHDSTVSVLRLRITCERCGRKIRPMLLYKARRKKRPSDRLRFLRTRRLNKDKPFLIIHQKRHIVPVG